MTPTEQEIQSIRHYLHENLPGAINMLRAMVTTNSFTANKHGVLKLAEMTADYFAPLGFTAETIPAADPSLGPHLVLTRHGLGPHTVGFISHLDTVYTADEEAENDFHWREERHNGHTRLYGPGTIDIKGGTVMAYLTLAALRHTDPELFNQTTFMVLLNAAEERLVPDFGDLCRQRLPGSHTLAALVFEAGRLQDEAQQLVVARKGMGRYTVTVDGRSAHAGTSHQQGANAIVQMADVVQRIAAYTDYERELTFNVGTFHGGTLVNRVPHHAHINVEFRTFDPHVYDEALHKMAQLDGYSSIASATDGYPCQTSVRLLDRCSPWPVNPRTDRLYAHWQTAAQQLGFDLAREERGGLSDGNNTWYHVPTIDGLGPLGGNAHSSQRSADGRKDQEYVIRESFVPKALLNTLGLRHTLTTANDDDPDSQTENSPKRESTHE